MFLRLHSMNIEMPSLRTSLLVNCASPFKLFHAAHEACRQLYMRNCMVAKSGSSLFDALPSVRLRVEDKERPFGCELAVLGLFSSG